MRTTNLVSRVLVVSFLAVWVLVAQDAGAQAQKVILAYVSPPALWLCPGSLRKRAFSRRTASKSS